MVHIDLFHQRNPLIDECSSDTLANIQAMLGRIQVLKIEQQAVEHKNTCHNLFYSASGEAGPAEALYIRLLELVKEAVEHEIAETGRGISETDQK